MGGTVMSMAESHDHRESRAQYEKVISVVYHQTTPKQPAMVPGTAVRITCSQAGMNPATCSTKLEMAVKNGDLIEKNDHYCVVDDLDRLRRAAEAVANEVPVDQDTLGKINRSMKQLRESDQQ